MFGLGIKIDLSLGAFQPRAETAEWTRLVISKIKRESKKQPGKIWRVLDIFAGSGFIGLAILKNVLKTRVDFAEIKPQFIQQIKLNLELNQIDLSRTIVVQSDVFENVNGRYDYILANPPYVAQKRKFLVQDFVLENDPPSALWGGEDGLRYIRKLLQNSEKHLTSGGFLYFEFSPEQKNEIEKIARNCNFELDFFKDKNNIFRWAKAKMSS